MNHMEDYLQTEFPHLNVWLTSITEQWAVIAVQGPKSRDIIAAAGRRHRHVGRGDAAYVGARGQDLRRADAAVPHVVHRRPRLRGQRAGRLRQGGLGSAVGRGREARRLRLRHRGDARAARREGLHHRRPGHRRHGDAERCRARLGGRQEEDRLRRHSRPDAARPRRHGPPAAGRPQDQGPEDRAGRRRADRRRSEAADPDEDDRPRHVELLVGKLRPRHRAGAGRGRPRPHGQDALRADAGRVRSRWR